MKKMNIQVYTTDKEPEGYTPFSIIFGSTWRAYDAGELNPEKLLLMSVLYRRVNPYNGIGQTSYEEICILLKRKPTPLNVNAINKLVVELRDIHELIWFPNHSGRREFPYQIADFKLAQKENETTQKWIDIKPHLQSQKQSGSRSNSPTNATIQPEAQPRWKPPEQRSERSNSDGFKSTGDVIRERESRASQTNTDNQT